MVAWFLRMSLLAKALIKIGLPVARAVADAVKDGRVTHQEAITAAQAVINCVWPKGADGGYRDYVVPFMKGR